MTRWISHRVLALIGALGMAGAVGEAAKAQDVNSGAFADEAAARDYLATNPTGPLARSAFLALVEFDLARDHAGFSRQDIADGFAEQPGASVTTMY